MIIMSKRYFLHNPFLFILFVFMVSCNQAKNTTSEGNSTEVIPDDIVEMRFDQIRIAGIDTGSIEMRLLCNTLQVNGIISVPPGDFATVCSPLGGFVRSSNLLPGNPVAKGQTLVIIENNEFVDIQENYLESKNRLEYAEAEFKRHSDLYKEDVYSEKNLQQVTADYKNLKAQVSALEQKLALIGLDPSGVHEDNISRSIALKSPISGFIKTVNVNIGKSISATDILFEIVNNDNLFLELTLFEKDANKVYQGQKIRFFINNETEEHEAVIHQTGRSVDADKTYKVYATISKGCKNLLSGMYVNAIIETSGNKVTALPSDAIVSFDDMDYIFIFDKNKVENGNPFTEYRIIEVKKGITEGGYTEVILPAGFDYTDAKVVVKGAYNLLSAKKNAGEMAC
jgi:cobalt-zinc-cadmium efflux system membrane fusion protein